MTQQYQPTTFKGTPADRRKLMVDVACLLVRLRSTAEDAGEPLTGREEDAFWRFISTLPKDSQTSVIN